MVNPHFFAVCQWARHALRIGRAPGQPTLVTALIAKRSNARQSWVQRFALLLQLRDSLRVANLKRGDESAEWVCKTDQALAV